MASRKSVLIKVVLAVLGLAGVGFLLTRSMSTSGAAPLVIDAAHLSGWTLEVQPAVVATDPVVVLRPPPDLPGPLFRQIFKRVMESMSAPGAPGIALLLQGELDRAADPARLTAAGLLAEARAAGLGVGTVQPRCLGYRRVSDPRGAQQLYFVLFDMPAFAAFRARVAPLIGSGFDPAALSPVLFVALAESSAARWTPLRADPATDCIAPVATS